VLKRLLIQRLVQLIVCDGCNRIIIIRERKKWSVKCKLTSTTPYLGPDLLKSKKYLEFVEGIYYDYDVIEEHGLVN
jgi:hypothetical protein